MSATVHRRTIDLAGLDVPLVELAGTGDEPTLTVIAGVHGCEYASMAAVRHWSATLEGRDLRVAVAYGAVGLRVDRPGWREPEQPRQVPSVGLSSR